MKTVIKILSVVLAVVVLAATALCLLSEGALMWLKEPVVKERTAVAIPTDATEPAAEAAAEEAAAEPENLPYTRELTAKSYFVYDVREGEYLQLKGDVNEKLYPASITKVLSVYVLLQHMDEDTTVTVGDALTLVQPDSSVANLQEGDKLTVSDLVAAMMLPSGNDAAQVAAVAAGRTISGDSSLSPEAASKVFVEEMNKQAKALGMTGSHFVNADGFHHDDHYTTMADLVTLSEKVLADPVILGYTSMIQKKIQLQDREETWRNTNALLHEQHETYISATIGLKTGYTGEAGNCLLTAFFKGDRLLVIGVFGCPKESPDRYLDTAELYNTTVI